MVNPSHQFMHLLVHTKPRSWFHEGYYIVILSFSCNSILSHYGINVLLCDVFTMISDSYIIISLYCCIIKLWYYDSILSLYHYLTILLYYYITMQLYYHITVSLYSYTVILWYSYIAVSSYCMTILLYYYIIASLYYYVGILILSLYYHITRLLYCSNAILQYDYTLALVR